MNGTIRVLHVDDSLLDIELVKDALTAEEEDFSLRSVRSRREFEEQIEQGTYDIILSDFNILGFEGFKVLDLAREKNPLMPVIIVTGTGSEEIAVEAMKRGAADYVIKHPSHIRRLPETIRRALEGCRIRVKQQESEDLYRTAVEHSNDGFALVKGDQHIYVNEKFLNLFGYASLDELKVDGPYGMIHPDDRERVLAYSRRRQSGKAAPERYEYKGVRKDGATICIEASVTHAVYRGEQVVLAYLRDVTERRIAEEELKRTTEKLRKSLVGTVQAMSLTVETRDPYTAGHQRRVASLAGAIAREMHISDESAETITMAAAIHDIGKMSVPAEILSKPGKLTALEMRLIRVHPQTGYDILKDVDLPSPIAQIILEHHERLDGSGYPQGLANGDILLESQILAVADVVEAISSNRPYRPAHGVDMALDEIEKNRGLLYNVEAVDACLKLFRHEGFSLE